MMSQSAAVSIQAPGGGTTSPPDNSPVVTFTLDDTAGCSCEQIIAALGLGAGHTMHGCSQGAMEDWVELVSP